MALKGWINDMLEGGLPQVLDWGGQVPPGEATADPERSAPTDVVGLENSNPAGNFLNSVSTDQIVKIGGFVVGAMALFYVAKRL